MSVIDVRDVRKTYRVGDIAVHALRGVSLRVERGEYVAVMGHSGSGKSTLMNILGCLDTPTSGVYRLAGLDVRDVDEDALSDLRNRFIGFVFQSYNLIPNLSALQNVMLPMEFAGVSRGERRERAEGLLDQVGLKGGKQQRRPAKLSGGEQQRVAIARALANRPKLILADEPTGNLDSKTGRVIVSLLRGLARSEDTTILAVTHDLRIAQSTDMTFEMEDGQLVAGEGVDELTGASAPV
jgi:putative ABC transport system ATP-binding protein